MDPGSFIQLQALFAGSCTIAATVLTVTGTTGGYTLARTSAGVLTLTAPIATNSTPTAFVAGVTQVVLTLGQSGTYNVVITSATVITISTFAVDGTTPTDKNITSLIVYNKQPEL